MAHFVAPFEPECPGYNMKRMIQMFGVQPLIQCDPGPIISGRPLVPTSDNDFGTAFLHSLGRVRTGRFPAKMPDSGCA